LSEITVELDLVQRGFNVARPLVVDRYDTVAIDGQGRMWRVQTKTARVESRTSDPTMKVSLDPPYHVGDYDVLAIVRPETLETFYVSADELVDGQTSVTLKWVEATVSEGTYWVETYRDWPMKTKGDESNVHARD
jgi:hypothetical protein